MKTEYWITIISASIVAIGWFVTAYFNRQKDVAAKRLDYRLIALESFLPVWFIINRNSDPFSDPKFIILLEEARSNFQLYGLADEIENMEAFVKAVEDKDLEQANSALSVLVPLTRNRIRKELEIEEGA